jgi:hypothetical protein
MRGSARSAPDDAGRIVIYQSTDREGSTFSLSPATRRKLEERFGDSFQVTPRIFVAHAKSGSFERLHGRQAKQLLALLTGFDNDLLGQLGDIEFRNAVTDQLILTDPGPAGFSGNVSGQQSR